jgi:hypothetical protein
MVFLIPAENVEDDAGTEATRADLREKALAASYDEYKELTAAWRNLDTKAQGNITIAGIFIAGAFAYLTKISQPPALYEKVFFVFAMIFLVISVVLSIKVLEIRNVPPHYLGFMRQIASHLQEQADEELKNSLPVFYNYHSSLWASANEKMIKLNKEKGEYLWAAQVFLVIAILTAVMLTILKILS